MTNAVCISNSVLEAIILETACSDCEKGGIIGWKNQGFIDTFFLDKFPESANVRSYTPNIKSLENTINISWKESEISFCGFVHSHMNTSYPSEADLELMNFYSE